MSNKENCLKNTIDYEIRCFKWEDVKRYFDKIVGMQVENIYGFHYPEKEPNVEFVKEKILELEGHLKKDNTYFIGAIKEENLYGYIWGYVSVFIDEKRMNINSLYIDRKVRGKNIGQELMNAIKRISIDNGCDSIATHYATFNKKAGKFYLNNGFESSRIEMICKLRNN